MKKWVGILLTICIILLGASCHKDEFETRNFKTDILMENSEDIKLLFGDIEVLTKEAFTETYRSYNKIITFNYDVWRIEYTNFNKQVKQTLLNNRADFISQISGLILEAISNELLESVIPKEIIVSINYENFIWSIDSIDDVPKAYYPINLQLDGLPSNFLIVIFPREDQIKSYNDIRNQLVAKIRLLNLNNVLLLDGDDAYEMDVGLFIHQGEYNDENISVENTLKWIESNN